MTVTPEIQQITDIIRQTVPAERIYLFGSHAYGTPHEHSDYDFYVVIPDGSMRPLDAMDKVHWEVAQTSMKKPIDVMASYASRFHERKKFNTLERKIERDGVLLHERTRHRDAVA